MGVTQKRKDDAPKFPLNGEIDLMPYFKDNEKGGNILKMIIIKEESLQKKM